ncbi:Olfactory receptor 15 [Heterocephalus glaber]|uniref:Olfactory receptor 15 n=1 Tax=Heterocephalus glaber TaxID=10181 RepID=G5B3R3_HETGA|nr:Olfactory receptor 15 [Heterocephalus glaber]
MAFMSPSASPVWNQGASQPLGQRWGDGACCWRHLWGQAEDGGHLQLPFCGDHTLDHFYRELPMLIKLACGDTSANELALTLLPIPFVMVPLLLVVISYPFIGRAVPKLPSTEGRHKALSTCSSHLLVVTMYFGPSMYLYLLTSSNSSQAKFMSFFYCVITLLLNPLIYT